MNRRLLLASALLGILVASAGCTSFLGSNQPSQAQLSQNATYDWNATADVYVNLTSNQYQAVINVTNQSTLDVYRYETLSAEQPIDVSAVQFRYPNGTVVNASSVGVETKNSKTVLTLPARDGKVAYTASAAGRSFSLPTFVKGSYEVVLPQGMRVGFWLMGNVRPRGYDTRVADGRMHIYWADVTADSISVQYFLGRDLYIFGGLIVVLAVAALVGLAYLWVQVRRLIERREEMGLNVDVEDDDFGGGPPRP